MKRKDILKSREYWITMVQLGLYEMMENYRKENKMSKTELADKLGVSKSYISQVLNGNFDHKISKFVDTSLALGKIPMIKYVDLDEYITHDSLNISTTVKVAKQIDFTYDFAHLEPIEIKSEKKDFVAQHLNVTTKHPFEVSLSTDF